MSSTIKSILTEGDATIKCSVGRQHVQVSFAVVALASLVDIGLRQEQQAGTRLIPFHLHFVSLEECLLGHWCRVREIQEWVNLDRRWCTFFLGHKCSDVGIAPRTQFEIGHALKPEFGRHAGMK